MKTVEITCMYGTDGIQRGASFSCAGDRYIVQAVKGPHKIIARKYQWFDYPIYWVMSQYRRLVWALKP